jgi:hypothetical protein
MTWKQFGSALCHECNHVKPHHAVACSQHFTNLVFKPKSQKREVIPKKVQPKTPTNTLKKTEVQRNANTQPFKLVDKKRRNPA